MKSTPTHAAQRQPISLLALLLAASLGLGSTTTQADSFEIHHHAYPEGLAIVILGAPQELGFSVHGTTLRIEGRESRQTENAQFHARFTRQLQLPPDINPNSLEWVREGNTWRLSLLRYLP